MNTQRCTCGKRILDAKQALFKDGEPQWACPKCVREFKGQKIVRPRARAVDD